jgi:alcohol dehydrogenase
MKAVQINEYGGPEVVSLQEASKPIPGEGQVLVEVHAASINPWDNKVRQGAVKDAIPLNFPATLGGDLSGVVAEVGNNVTDFKAGDEVYGTANSVSGQGSFAEFAPAKATSLALKPQGIDFEAAAALPLVAESAYLAIVELLGVQEGQKVLIHGGAGGIGSVAIQLAKHAGAYVVSTASSSDLDFVKSLGADKVLDYKTQDFSTLVEGCDAVFDTVGGETNAKSYQVLKQGGKLASMLEQPNEELMDKYGVTAVYISSIVNTKHLEAISELVETGAIKVHVDKVFPLEQTGEAMAYLENGGHHGKVVIQVK